MIDMKTLEKMILLSNTGGYTELDKDEYINNITQEEAINRFRFILEYNDIRYKEVNITSKDNDNINIVGFYIPLKDLQFLDMDKLKTSIVYISCELDDEAFIGFEYTIKSDLENTLEFLKDLTCDSDEVNNLIHSHKLFKGTHRYDKYIIQFDNEKLIRINNNYLN